MKNKNQLVSQQDTKRFISKSNQLINFYRKKILLAFIKGDKKSLCRLKKKIRFLKLNKKRDEYPDGYINSPKKVAIYTVLYGNYDSIKTVKTKNSLCDYFIFSDQEVPQNSGWIKRDFVFPSYIGNNPVIKNRYLKMMPHILFQNYEYSIYLDSSICIELDAIRLLSRLGDKFIGLFDHHRGTTCLYTEGQILKEIGKVPPKDIDLQLKKYEKEGFPHDFGFTECGIIIREHNNLKCVKLMNTWFEEFYRGAKRDQLSFMYSVWKNNLCKSDIACLGDSYMDEPIFSSEAHKK